MGATEDDGQHRLAPRDVEGDYDSDLEEFEATVRAQCLDDIQSAVGLTDMQREEASCRLREAIARWKELEVPAHRRGGLSRAREAVAKFLSDFATGAARPKPRRGRASGRHRTTSSW